MIGVRSDRRPVRLHTRRLTLRELSANDLDYVAGLLADEVTMRFWPRPYTRSEALEWIERQRARYESDGCAFWLVLRTDTGEPIGQAGVLTQRIGDVTEWGLGYIINRRHWRQGYAAEAAAECLRFVFQELDRSRAVALVRPENAPSIAVTRKLGMHEESRTQYYGYEHIVFVRYRD